ncbi:hypothetical protein K402DRAFT_399265 [Aulographum hederae CBS 113979]|uniref:Zn(2)-C6 fungal-type domain-containing protein n=1 Tax=Aulographum hederae CBS 113979 TaxID=1176131 RepID=A0A6G1GI69_9PEZI|nr:hypothetical protein K402DRAFT_399265 [Aulographum hederae CBS 113979]
MPCSNCERQNIECRSSPDSNSCAECVRRGLSSCDLVVLPSTWRNLSRERARLQARLDENEAKRLSAESDVLAAEEAARAAEVAVRAAEAEARTKVHRALRTAGSARAKDFRLRKMLALLDRREKSLFDRELKAIEDEEREERKAEDRARSTESSSVVASSSAVVPEDVSFSQLVDNLSPSFWKSLGSGGEMPAPTAGSSQGS